MPKSKTVYEDCDVLVVGGGMAGTGATFESRHWGRDLKIVCCLLYTSPSPRDSRVSRMPSSA